MNKAEAVEVIYLHLNGGKASSDNNLKREEISMYFGTALGTAIKSHIFESKGVSQADKAGEAVLFETSIPESFYERFEFTPEFNSEEGVYTATIDGILSLQYGWGIRNPRAKKNPEADFNRLPNASMTSAFPIVFSGQYFYWTEGNTIYFKNMPTPVCPMVVSIIKDPGEADETDEITLPKYIIDTAIKITTEYFQRHHPASRRFDDKGTNERES